MVAEVLEQLQPSRGGVFVDGTVGLGGHARALLEAGASRLLGVDRDPAAVELARERLRDVRRSGRVVHGDYRQTCRPSSTAEGFGAVDGVLLDLGVSSMQLDAPGRGFSFRRDEPLDMRMDTSAGPTAAEALAGADEKTLADVIYELGEDRHARRIARAIVAARAARAHRRRPGGWPTSCAGRCRGAATRASIRPRARFRRCASGSTASSTGWATACGAAAARLAPGGRLVVITFHSLEDRIVKHVLRSLQAAGAPVCAC